MTRLPLVTDEILANVARWDDRPAQDPLEAVNEVLRAYLDAPLRVSPIFEILSPADYDRVSAPCPDHPGGRRRGECPDCMRGALGCFMLLAAQVAAKEKAPLAGGQRPGSASPRSEQGGPGRAGRDHTRGRR